ncbi:MAG TPA: hypothetical protein VE890_12515 [Thermoguttaceae bacterium]|nr:hypothetical protein [Thermoguttaceae bacterium]
MFRSRVGSTLRTSLSGRSPVGSVRDDRRLAGCDIVRVALGLLLLVAAGLKGYELATSPVAGTSLLDSRWFLIGLVEFEFVFGPWLLVRGEPALLRVARAVANGVFHPR